MIKSPLEKKGFVVHSSSRDIRAESQGRSLEIGCEPEAMEEWCLQTYAPLLVQLAFSNNVGSPAQGGTTPSRMGSSMPAQGGRTPSRMGPFISVISKKMPHSLPTGQLDRGNSSTEAYLPIWFLLISSWYFKKNPAYCISLLIIF